MDETEKSKEELPRNSDDFDPNNLMKLFSEIIDCFAETLNRISETSDSNQFLKGDETLNKKHKSMDKTHWSSKRHCGIRNEIDGHGNSLSLDNCRNIETSGLCIDNSQADNSGCISTKPEKIVINILLSDADTCSGSQTSEPRNYHCIKSQESDNSSQSSSDESEASSCTITCLDDGSETSESTTEDRVSSDSEMSDAALKLLINSKITSSSCSISVSHPELTSTTITKDSCRAENYTDFDSRDCNPKIFINPVRCLDFNTPDSDSSPCEVVQFPDGYSDSYQSTDTISRSKAGSYQSDLKFLDYEQELHPREPSNSYEPKMWAVLQEAQSLIKDKGTFIVVDENGSFNIEESSKMELDFFSRKRLQFLQEEFQYLKRLSDEFSNSAIPDNNPTLIKHQRSSISSNKTKKNDLKTMADNFKIVVKCHPINKFEIPPYEYANTEKTLCTIGEKLPNSRMAHATNITQLDGNDEHRQERCFPNIDSHTIMFSEVEDCFLENSSIICDSLINEYFNSASKLMFFMLKKIKGLSAEDYELRMSSLLSLDDELGFLSAKLITTINDWMKQCLEIKQNLQNDAQSETRSRGFYHMGVLRICMRLAKILLDSCLEKQLQLEKYESALIFSNKQSN